jgi:DNA primase
MAGNIPQQFIDDLLSRVYIVDVIKSYMVAEEKKNN